MARYKKKKKGKKENEEKVKISGFSSVYITFPSSSFAYERGRRLLRYSS